MYTGPGGGAYTGPGEPYMRNWPPIPVLIDFMESIGLVELPHCSDRSAACSPSAQGLAVA